MICCAEEKPFSNGSAGVMRSSDDLEELGELLDKHPDDLKQADLALRQSSFALVTGDYDAALAAAQKSLQFAEGADNLGAKARAYHRWGRTNWQHGHTEEAEGYLNQALTLAQTGREPRSGS